MRTAVQAIILLLALAFLGPVSAHASWWNGDADKRDLNLDSGYDVNTVSTVSGKVVAIYLDGPQPHALVALEAGEGLFSVVLGPRDYWAKNGIDLKIGDRVTVRGSKAQGEDGVVFIFAQWLSEDSLGQKAVLRSESGRPVWAGGGNRFGQQGSRPSQLRQHSPGRSGGGRMGR